MNSETHPDVVRHRLLEGVLLRLARRSDVGAFILRGGVLMRHWFRPVSRSADDVDLVATFPFSIEETEARFLPVLEVEISDGVCLDPSRTRVAGIRLDTGNPGVRVFATGTFGGDEVDFNVDITFGPFPHPAPVLVELPTASGVPAKVWACRPEAVTGQKLQALRDGSELTWRPKDLNDLRLLLARVPMNATDLRGAIASYMADLSGTLEGARALFGAGSWWGMKLSSARWLDYVRTLRDPDAPRDLAAVVAEIAHRLAPVLEGSQ